MAAGALLHVRMQQAWPSLSGRQSDQGRPRAQEVLLVKRDPETHKVRDVWRSDSSQAEGNTLINTPAWPGEWELDVVCRVSDGLDSSIWLKATGRALAASPEACLLSSSGRSRSFI